MPFPESHQRTGRVIVSMLAVLITTSFPVSLRAQGRSSGAGTTGSGTAADPYRVPRVEMMIEVDGELSESVWSRALSLELPYETNPSENTPAPVRTEVLLAYTETHLLVAFRAHDPEPDRIRAHLRDRDDEGGDDLVAIVLDTFNDERRAFRFMVNPRGVQAERIQQYPVVMGGGNWDAIWASDACITDWGWSAEMAIPFESLRFQRSEGDQVWGFDARRMYPRTRDCEIGLQPQDRANDNYLSQLARIAGFAGARPGRNIELDPTLMGVRTDARPDFPAGGFARENADVEFGLTAQWGLTPNSVVQGTFNPDFSQVEADALQLDINTPFALFYGEKRPFFLESSDYFTTRFNAVHTRTLRDPEWGLKVTGKEGGHTIGACLVRDALTNLIFPGSQSSDQTSVNDPSTAAVLRYKHDLGRRFTLGLIGTDRAGTGYSNRLYGIDGTLRLTDSDMAGFQVLGTRTRYAPETASAHGQPGGAFSDRAVDLTFRHSGRTFGYWGGYREVGEDFRADLGFMPQVGYRTWNVSTALSAIPQPGSWYEWLLLAAGADYTEDTAGNLLNRDFSMWGGYYGPMDSAVYFVFHHRTDAYNGREFDNDLLFLHLRITPSGALSLAIDNYFGERIDYTNTRLGRIVQINPGLTWRPGRHLQLSLSAVAERMKIEAGRLYTAAIGQMTGYWHFDARTYVRTTVQYVDYDYNVDAYTVPVDEEYRRLFTQLLFSYKVNPRTVLFLGYGDNSYGAAEYELTRRNRTVFAKLGYAWVF